MNEDEEKFYRSSEFFLLLEDELWFSLERSIRLIAFGQVMYFKRAKELLRSAVPLFLTFIKYFITLENTLELVATEEGPKNAITQCTAKTVTLIICLP